MAEDLPRGYTMKKKDTEELEQALSAATDVRAYFAENGEELAPRTLAEHLQILLNEKKLTRSLVAGRTRLDQSYAYHIFDGRKPNPSRQKVLALALAMELTPQEAQYLLYYAHCPRLYVREPWDSILWHALEKHLSVTDTNNLLTDLHETPLLE